MTSRDRTRTVAQKAAFRSIAWLVVRRSPLALVFIPALTGQLDETFQGFENLWSCFLFAKNAAAKRRPDRELEVGAHIVEIQPASWPIVEAMDLLAELVDIDLPLAPPGKVGLEGSELASQFPVVRLASKLAQ